MIAQHRGSRKCCLLLTCGTFPMISDLRGARKWYSFRRLQPFQCYPSIADLEYVAFSDVCNVFNDVGASRVANMLLVQTWTTFPMEVLAETVQRPGRCVRVESLFRVLQVRCSAKYARTFARSAFQYIAQAGWAAVDMPIPRSHNI